jgi:hypothetical protein
MKANAILLALAAAFLIAGSGGAFCQESEGALGNPLPAAVQDPSLKTSRYFPPSLGTAGVADTDPALSSATKLARGHGADCSSVNPCAVPPPARDRVVITSGRS